MARLHVEASGTARAAPEQVWALLADAEAYSHWGPWSGSGYRDSGNGSGRGPGAVRWMRYGRRTTTVERLLEVEPPRRMTYTVIAGLPVRNYHAEVQLEPDGAGGTRVRWFADFDRTPLGRLVHRKLRAVYPEVVRSLIGASEQRREG